MTALTEKNQTAGTQQAEEQGTGLNSVKMVITKAYSKRATAD